MPSKFNLLKTSSIGKGLQKSFKIVHINTGKEINENNKIGELVYFGKNVCLGYSLSIKDLSLGDQNREFLKLEILVLKIKTIFFILMVDLIGMLRFMVKELTWMI